MGVEPTSELDSLKRVFLSTVGKETLQLNPNSLDCRYLIRKLIQQPAPEMPVDILNRLCLKLSLENQLSDTYDLRWKKVQGARELKCFDYRLLCLVFLSYSTQFNENGVQPTPLAWKCLNGAFQVLTKLSSLRDDGATQLEKIAFQLLDTYFLQINLTNRGSNNENTN